MTRYQNRQLYSECQLVAMWNACRYYNMPVALPKMGTRHYKQICKQACAIHGAALFTEFELTRVGLTRKFIKPRLAEVRTHLPVHLAIFCHKGFHSVLVVSVKGNKVLLANYAKGRSHWLRWSVLQLRDDRTNYKLPFQYIPATCATALLHDRQKE